MKYLIRLWRILTERRVECERCDKKEFRENIRNCGVCGMPNLCPQCLREHEEDAIKWQANQNYKLTSDH